MGLRLLPAKPAGLSPSHSPFSQPPPLWSHFILHSVVIFLLNCWKFVPEQLPFTGTIIHRHALPEYLYSLPWFPFSPLLLDNSSLGKLQNQGPFPLSPFSLHQNSSFSITGPTSSPITAPPPFPFGHSITKTSFLSPYQHRRRPPLCCLTLITILHFQPRETRLTPYHTSYLSLAGRPSTSVAYLPYTWNFPPRLLVVG